MNHVVRRATLNDIPDLQRVYRRAWRAAYQTFLEPEDLDELSDQRVRRFDWSVGIDSPDAGVFVGLDSGGRLLGVVQADEVVVAPGDLPEITMLYVDPAGWGTGLAAELLRSGTAWIADRGHDHARVRTNARHQRARRFYEREGWTLDPTVTPVSTDLATLVYYRRILT